MSDLEFRQTREEISVNDKEFATGVRTSHSGLLPSPQDLAEYERIRPGTADEIVALMKEALENRISSERKELEIREKEVDGDNEAFKLTITAGMLRAEVGGKGQYILAALLIVLIVATCFCAACNQPWFGAGFFLALSTLFVFVFGARFKSDK